MNLQKKLANLLATTKRKRPYYCEVEYLESTGTQWINTGFITKANSEYRMLLNFKYTDSLVNDKTLFGGRISGGNRSPLLYYATSRNPSKPFYFNYAGYAAPTSPTGEFDISKDEKHTIDLYANEKTHKSSVTLDGKSIYSDVSWEGNLYCGYPIGIFCDNASGTAVELSSFTLYSFQIYEEEKLVRDMIPVLDWDMKPAMYDKVSGVLYENKGTGNFIAGLIREK